MYSSIELAPSYHYVQILFQSIIPTLPTFCGSWTCPEALQLPLQNNKCLKKRKNLIGCNVSEKTEGKIDYLLWIPRAQIRWLPHRIVHAGVLMWRQAHPSSAVIPPVHIVQWRRSCLMGQNIPHAGASHQPMSIVPSRHKLLDGVIRWRAWRQLVAMR